MTAEHIAFVRLTSVFSHSNWTVNATLHNGVVREDFMKRSISTVEILTFTLISSLISIHSHALSIRPERPYYGHFSVISQLSVTNDLQSLSDTPVDANGELLQKELNSEQRETLKSHKALEMRNFYLKLLILKGHGN